MKDKVYWLLVPGVGCWCLVVEPCRGLIQPGRLLVLSSYSQGLAAGQLGLGSLLGWEDYSLGSLG